MAPPQDSRVGHGPFLNPAARRMVDHTFHAFVILDDEVFVVRHAFVICDDVFVERVNRRQVGKLGVGERCLEERQADELLDKALGCGGRRGSGGIVLKSDEGCTAVRPLLQPSFVWCKPGLSLTVKPNAM